MGNLSYVDDIQRTTGNDRRDMRYITPYCYVVERKGIFYCRWIPRTLYLKDRVWIDETYLYDSSLLHDDSYKKKRRLSKNQLCIVVAIDCHKNTYAVICDHGKPSASRIFEVLKNHIVSGSTH